MIKCLHNARESIEIDIVQLIAIMLCTPMGLSPRKQEKIPERVCTEGMAES